MKSLINYIVEERKSIEEWFADFVNSAPEEPRVYDDTESWEANGDFDWYQYDNGDWDESFEIIDHEMNGKIVAGWCSKKSFDETKEMVPPMMLSWIQGKGEQLYKKRYNEVLSWEGKVDKYEYKVLQFKQYVSHNGIEMVEFWYLVAIDR